LSGICRNHERGSALANRRSDSLQVLGPRGERGAWAEGSEVAADGGRCRLIGNCCILVTERCHCQLAAWIVL
jgi:hypothetical protein